MKYFALAMVAVLAMASVSMAGYTVAIDGGGSAVVSDKVDLGFGLVAYDVHIVGAKSFEKVAVLNVAMTDVAALHQVWNAGNSVTPWNGMLPGALAPPQNSNPFDTHFAFASDAVTLLKAADKAIETNNQVSDLPQDYTYFGGVAQVNFPGMGTFDARGTNQAYTFQFPGELDPAGYDFMHIVMSAETPIVMLVGDCSIGGVTRNMQIPIGVPEPGTVIMLVAGALCLLGIRRK